MYRPSTQRFEALWVSDLEGKEMREVGHVPMEDGQYVLDADWLPDGRHAWFFYRKTLYTVPVD
jgi:hypothetical protein